LCLKKILVVDRNWQFLSVLVDYHPVFLDQIEILLNFLFKCQGIAKSKVKVTMPAHASPSGFVIPYYFSISITGSFAFGHNAETCFRIVYITCGT